MQKVHYSVVINAPKEIVWKTMLEDVTYRQWAAVFMPGSQYIGNWNKGSKIQFVSPDNEGRMSGMASEIAENKSGEFISIHHMGLVTNGVVDTTSPVAKKWDGHEDYTLIDKNGQTELKVDMDMADEMVEEMNASWPKALAKLKELSEAAYQKAL